MQVSQRFLNAKDLGFTGAELQKDINSNRSTAKLEKIRACLPIKMGLIAELTEAQTRQHTQKLLGLHRWPIIPPLVAKPVEGRRY
ncbi:MAG: PrpF domain-containing protein [Moraxella osloensis]